MWASVLVLAVSLAVAAASEGQEDNPRCFLQIEGSYDDGKYNAVMGYTGGLGWRKIDSNTGNAVEGFDIFWYKISETHSQYVIGSRPVYFATVGPADYVGAPSPEKQKCLPDGSTVRMKESDEIVAKIWRLKAPYFSSCPVKTGSPRIAEGGNVVSLSENTWSSLRDCLDVASDDHWVNTELTAVIYEENEGRCKGVTNQTEFEWNPKEDKQRSCFFQCLPVPGYPFQNSQLTTTTYMGQKDSFEECRAYVVSVEPPPQSAGPLWTASDTSCRSVAKANQFQVMLAAPDSSPMFQWCWHPRSAFVLPESTEPPVELEGCYHNAAGVHWVEHCSDPSICIYASQYETEATCVSSSSNLPMWAANEGACRRHRKESGNCQN